jgi:hypothetical protein
MMDHCPPSSPALDFRHLSGSNIFVYHAAILMNLFIYIALIKHRRSINIMGHFQPFI